MDDIDDIFGVGLTPHDWNSPNGWTKPYFNGFEDRDYVHLGYKPNHMDAYEKHDEMDDVELFGHINEIEFSA